MIKTVIVDDESSGREILTALLAKVAPEVTIAGEADNVESGIQLIKKEQPSLVFLDVEMPSGTGFDILEQLDPIDFEVIFVTAYQKYAINAFKFSAVDFLLKPIDLNDLKTAVEKAAKQQALKKQDERIGFLLETLKSQNDSPQKIMLPTNDGFQLHHFDDIVRCESQGNYTQFFKLDGKSELVSKTLKEYDPILSAHGFFRIHRSHIINLKHITRYIKGKGGEVVMCDGAVLDVSRDKKEALLKKLS